MGRGVSLVLERRAQKAGMSQGSWKSEMFLHEMYMEEATFTGTEMLLQVSSWKSSSGNCRGRCCKKSCRKWLGIIHFMRKQSPGN